MSPFSSIREIASLSGYDFETTCRHNTFYAYLGDHLAVCKILSKYKLFVDTRDTGVVPHLIMDGFWETWLTQCLARIVEPGNVCLDIGANFGYYSLLMSELCGKEGRTIAIEPNPQLCRVLRFTQNLHGWRFEIVEAAASDSNGETVLNIPQDNPGDASIVKRNDRPGQVNSEVKVKMVTIDTLAEQMGLQKVDVIKMDVEGVEPKVFEGMKNTIARNPNLKVIIEYSPYLYPDAAAFSNYLFDHFIINRIKDVESQELLDKPAMDKLIDIKDHTDLYLTRL